MHQILALLEIGGRLDKGRVDDVIRRVEKQPSLFPHLIDALQEENRDLRARAAYAIEHLTRQNPEWLDAYKEPVLYEATVLPEPETRWKLALILPRLTLTADDRHAAVQILLGYLNEKSSIARTCAMQGLAELALQDRTLLPRVAPLLAELTQTGTPAMRARGRMLLKRLNYSTSRS